MTSKKKNQNYFIYIIWILCLIIGLFGGFYVGFYKMHGELSLPFTIFLLSIVPIISFSYIIYILLKKEQTKNKNSSSI